MVSSTEQHHPSQPCNAPQTSQSASAAVKTQPAVGWRLRKHADYQRAYKASRKQHSSSMTYFAAPQAPGVTDGVRVGLTVGRVLGNAVTRNRIKRRMREAIRHNLGLLPGGVDVIFHPRPCVREMNFAELQAEIGRIFQKIAASRASRSTMPFEGAAGPS